ncbi:MAG: [FeFe] hydrogenase H-cluster maturation GTPase HydF [Escherichia coli]|nr:MAG: [FeFe] hydrogenase H-cluster maturation GTPase HydF [Escherichia coli]
MSLNDTPNSQRVNIGFFGCRNAGKSSLVNKITNQNLCVVSDFAGTTTDIVSKAMELLPLGAVLVVDTPGIDDNGELGQKRVEKTKEALRRCDIAVLVTDCTRELNSFEKNLINEFENRKVPYLVVKNKCDLLSETVSDGLFVSAKTGFGVEELKNRIATVVKTENSNLLLEDIVEKGDIVVLVTPIDESAPKGRLILPQQQVVRNVLDCGGINVVVKENELEHTLDVLKIQPKIVITDSQVFDFVANIVDESISLTSFSILMARKKGFLKTAVKGAVSIDNLKNGDTVLISEGCTHHRQCKDIGTVKLPKMLEKFTGKKLNFEFTSGNSFAENLDGVSLVIHCGGCMLNEKEMKYRQEVAEKNGVAFTNYGTAIAYMNSILKRSTKMISEISDILK